MSVLLCPWSDRDGAIERAISQALYPEYVEEPGHHAWFPAQQLGAPREAHLRYIAKTPDGRAVAYAALWEMRPRRYRFDLAVHPQFQRQGIGGKLLAEITRYAETLGATGLQARVRHDKLDALDFLTRRGYCESHRMSAYRRDFAPSDTERVEAAMQDLRAAGLAVATLAGVRGEPTHLARFYELYSAAREGWPDPDPDPDGPTALPPDVVARWLRDIEVPDAFFLATHQERYVGFTSIFGTGTAVHPAWRGRRIATSLKALSIADAQRRGVCGQTIGTANPAMRAVLERLGYNRLASEIRLLRELT